MKKFVLVIMIVSLAVLLLACEKQEGGSTNKGGTTKETEKAPFVGVEEYKEADFTDKTDFKVTKSDDAKDIEYDKIFLHGMNTAQLDLKFKDGKIGTLMISKVEKTVPENAPIFSIANTEVAKYSAAGVYHYVYSKGNTYYDFNALEEFSDEEMAKVIKGYSLEIGE